MLRYTFILQQVGTIWLAVPVGPGTEELSVYLELNETSLELFQHLMDGAEEKDLVDYLTSEYEVTKEEAKEHISAFLAHLRERGLLKDN